MLSCQNLLDTVSRRNILFELGKIEFQHHKNYKKAETYFDEAIELADSQVGASYWFKGNIAELRSDRERAIHYYTTAAELGDELHLQFHSTRSLIYLQLDTCMHPTIYKNLQRLEALYDSIHAVESQSEINKIHFHHKLELHQYQMQEKFRRYIYWTIFAVVCLVAIIVIGALAVNQRRKKHYLRLQQELQRNQARIYKMYESIEAKRDNGTLERAPMLALYRANLTASVTLWSKEEWASRLRKLSEQRSKDIPPFTILEREQLAEALERCFVTVITNLRDEAAKQKSRLSTEDIHLFLLLSLGYSIGVIRECLAASSDDVVRKRRVRLSGKLPEDILHLLSRQSPNR